MAPRRCCASPQKWPLFDEQYHLTAGYAYLRTGDFRLAAAHPPLAGMIAGLSLLLRGDINLPLDNPLWEQGNRYDFSDVFLWQAIPKGIPQGMLERQGMGIAVLGVLLLLGLFFWGRRLLGAAGGWLVLVAFDPNLIANSRIISTNLPLTALFVLAAWRLWCWLEEGRWYDLLLAGMFGGLTMAAKYNRPVFWPVAGVAALFYQPLGSIWRSQGIGGSGYSGSWGQGSLDSSCCGVSTVSRSAVPQDAWNPLPYPGAFLLGPLATLAGLVQEQ